jgi:endonuclease YncB( thermonuclease family)
MRARLSVSLLVLGLAAIAAGPRGAATAAGPEAVAALAGTEIARVTEIVDGDTLVLADGRQVRLVGIQAPKLPLGRAGFETWPLAEEAKAALAALSLGRDVRLAYGGARGDRHGRVLAHLADDAGRWVQGALLDAGMARVYGFADNRALLPEMLAREAAAREARRGIWADAFYAVRTPEEAARYLSRFELIQGRVVDVAEVRGRVYLNFGADWRSDFTATLAPPVRRLFEAEGIDPMIYRNRIVRVRGWLKSYNGPMMDITHPEQIEVVAE